MNHCGTNQKTIARALAAARRMRPSARVKMEYNVDIDLLSDIVACENILMESIYGKDGDDVIAGHRTGLCIMLQALPQEMGIVPTEAVQAWENAMLAVREARRCAPGGQCTR